LLEAASPREFAYQWWDRWQKAGGEIYDASKLPRLRSYGIQYVVFAEIGAYPQKGPCGEDTRVAEISMGGRSVRRPPSLPARCTGRGV
jgi:hypothetical protein